MEQNRLKSLTEGQKVNRNLNSELTMVQSLIVTLLLNSDKVLELFYFSPKIQQKIMPPKRPSRLHII